MLTGAIIILTVFYAGAVLATGRSWLAIREGAIGFSALRDVTGINDRALLRRLFGLTRPDGRYPVTFAAVIRHRRLAGVILADLPVHLLFLLALVAAALLGDGRVEAAVACAALAHAVLLGGAALSIVVGGYEALPD